MDFSKKQRRTAHLITVDENSERCIFSSGILDLIGFDVVVHKAFIHPIPYVSLLKTTELIFEEILKSEYEWHYIFEDDINMIEHITLEEIIKYEKISNGFFFLGVCKYGDIGFTTQYEVNEHPVYKVSGCVRGSHAVAFSKTELKNFMKMYEFFTSGPNPILHIDVLYELFTLYHPANVIRMDLQSSIPGHFGIIYQDRERFESLIPYSP